VTSPEDITELKTTGPINRSAVWTLALNVPLTRLAHSCHRKKIKADHRRCCTRCVRGRRMRLRAFDRVEEMAGEPDSETLVLVMQHVRWIA